MKNVVVKMKNIKQTSAKKNAAWNNLISCIKLSVALNTTYKSATDEHEKSVKKRKLTKKSAMNWGVWRM